MSDGDRNNHAALRQLTDTLVWVGVGLIAVYLFGSIALSVGADRAAINQAAQVGCAKGEEKACNGSYAEVRAANAAEQMVDLTIIQFLAGIVGVVLVGLTLKATRDAVREAGDATEMARKALEATEIATAKELRAYVHLEELVCESIEDAAGNRTAYLFSPRWKNFGQTPALDVRIGMSGMHWHGEELPPYWPFPEFPSLRGPVDARPNVIPPNHGVTLPGTRVDVRHLDEIASGHRRIFCWGWAEYKDIFGKPRRTSYSLRVRCRRVGAAHPSYTFVPYPTATFNCVDEQCGEEERARPLPPDYIQREIAKSERYARSLDDPSGMAWFQWMLDQLPDTFARNGDGSPVEKNPPRDQYGALLEGYKSRRNGGGQS